MKRIKAAYALPLAAAGLTACAEKAVQERPNILFIMTDDHTTQAMSCYGGNLIETPNMDRIANEGIRFDNCYATNALSGPSRACILTGKFGHVNGFLSGYTQISKNVVPIFFLFLNRAHFLSNYFQK